MDSCSKKTTLALIVSALLFCFRVSATPPAFQQCWRSDLEHNISEITAAGGVIYLFQENGTLVALENDGDRLWSAELGGRPVSNIVASGSSVFVATSTNATADASPTRSELRMINAASGVIRASVDIEPSDPVHLRENGRNIVASTSRGTISSYRQDDLTVVWRREIADSFTTGSVSNGSTLFVGAGPQLFAINSESGTILNMVKLDSPAAALTAVGSGQVAVGDSRGDVRMISAIDGKTLWRFRTGGSIRTLDSIGGGSDLIAGSADNFVYDLSASNGSVKWKRRLTSRVSDAAIDAAGKQIAVTAIEDPDVLVFGSDTGNLIHRINGFGIDAPRIRAVMFDGGLILAERSRIAVYSPKGCSDAADTKNGTVSSHRPKTVPS